jgi:hypothetical protein
MLLAAGGMAIFTRIGLTTSFVWPVLAGELVMGVGLGFIFATAMNSSTLGVEPSDAGVASALVNACQQIGGALGIALLSTIAASAATSFIAGHATAARPSSLALAQGAIHGYTTAFWISAGIFAVGSAATGLLYQRGVRVTAESLGEGEPALAA